MRAASHRVHCLASRSCLNSLITAKHFCPNFLKNQHPDLINAIILWWPGEGPSLSVTIIREVVIDNDCALLSIDVNGDSVTAGIINLLSYENFLDSLRVFGERAQSGQKVTITALALLNVVWSGFGVYNVIAFAVDLAGALPSQSGPLRDPIVSHHVLVDDGTDHCSEVWVFPRPTRVQNALVVDICKPFIEGELFNLPIALAIQVEPSDVHDLKTTLDWFQINRMLLTAPEPPLLLGPEALDAADDVQPILKDNSAFFS